MTPPPKASSLLGWIIWGLVANLYLVGFFQRVAPAVMVNELIRDFNISAATLGNLSAAYFYGYAAMQIPSGLLADSVGPRKLSSVAALCATIGILIFALAPNIWIAMAGRLIVGASVGVAFVSCMKLAGHWFPTDRFATVTGVALLLGNIGGVIAGVPLAKAVTLFGWKGSMLASAVVTLAGAFLIWYVVRDDPSERGYASYIHQNTETKVLPPLEALRHVLRERDNWLLFFAAGFSSAPLLVFAGLWGVPYLTQIYGLERPKAAVLASTMLLAWAAGGSLLGSLSDRIKRRKLPYLVANICATLLWAVFLFYPLPYPLLFPLFAAIGISSGGLIIGFAFTRELNQAAVAGTAGGFVNMSILGFAAILQATLGWVLDRHWDGKVATGMPIYSADAYFSAFAWLLGCAILSVAAIVMVQETYCKVKTTQL